jgi:hypothetical protein
MQSWVSCVSVTCSIRRGNCSGCQYNRQPLMSQTFGAIRTIPVRTLYCVCASTPIRPTVDRLIHKAACFGTHIALRLLTSVFSDGAGSSHSASTNTPDTHNGLSSHLTTQQAQSKCTILENCWPLTDLTLRLESWWRRKRRWTGEIEG